MIFALPSNKLESYDYDLFLVRAVESREILTDEFVV
jgi:hypothetical protein